jgi:acetyl-CoA C-acetyltransferase
MPHSTHQDTETMGDVIIAGVGQTDVGEHWNVGLRDLALAAIEEAVKDANGPRPEAIYVGNMLAPSLSNQAHLGALLADYAGLAGIEAATVEAAGASGGAALRQGYLAVASGLIDVALVVGLEKFTDRIGSEVEAAVATAGDSDFEAVQGLTPTSQAAMLMRRYEHEHAVPAHGFAGFALTAHLNGAGNPHAMFRRAIKAETYVRAPMISEPLNQYDIAPSADGAAAILLTRAGRLKSPAFPPVRIAGSASVVDTLAIHDREDALEFVSCRLSAARALGQSGASLEEMDFFEYHDAYSIYAALALESVGFAERGKGWKLAAEGAIALDGRIPTATMGGLKARGFAGGATGVYQAVEATLQLQGRAGSNQVREARWGLIQSMGGPGSTVVSHVLQGGN